MLFYYLLYFISDIFILSRFFFKKNKNIKIKNNNKILCQIHIR